MNRGLLEMTKMLKKSCLLSWTTTKECKYLFHFLYLPVQNFLFFYSLYFLHLFSLIYSKDLFTFKTKNTGKVLKEVSHICTLVHEFKKPTTETKSLISKVTLKLCSIPDCMYQFFLYHILHDL